LIEAEGPIRSMTSRTRSARGLERTNATLSAHEKIARQSVSRALVVVDLAVFVLTVVNQHGVARFVLGLTFFLVIPGWSVVGLLKLRNVPLEIGLTVASSLALLMTAAQVLMTIHVWRLAGLEMVTCLACLPSLVLQSRFRHSHRTRSK
jgi:uncharacterized membrane protein